MIRKISLLLLIALSLSSCVSSKKIVYFQGLSGQANKTAKEGATGENYETKIKSDDLLLIIVSAPNATEAEPFNLPLVSVQQPTVGMLDAVSAQSRFQTYLVDKNGNIEFPVLGTLKVGGLQKAEIVTMLNSKLEEYITQPIVNLRVVNYKISVLGEVLRPGEFPRTTERISVPEALALAGDLTIYGDRQDILLIRDVNGVKTHFSLDLTSADIVNSPNFYLQQNDILYVKPNKTRINSAGVGPNIALIISGLSLVLTAVVLITNSNN